ncbi:hypothetical protein [Bradyrhizobium sp. ARR65]|uniref:hypothetical protein n=1 Tax=Bradyrhizobium sp. ARR65 TaxID=1040989 RepID=UPI000464C2DE|nr:hypothetical protein [Bradyrhizobium sp. ARR65]
MKPWTPLAIAIVLTLQQAAAEDFSGNDLRDIRIGMAVADLPGTGYTDFACATDASRKLSGWSDWRSCPVGTDQLRSLRFGYDPATSKDGTIVAGHPANLTALIDDAGTVAGLKIETDPKARLYLRKKAFLFGPQVKARYGSEGWTCTQAQPDAGEQPVGGVYIKEKCTKTTDGRALVVERSLFRQAGQDERSFVDETRVTILRAHS